MERRGEGLIKVVHISFSPMKWVDEGALLGVIIAHAVFSYG